jgi:hypothetical protein
MATSDTVHKVGEQAKERASASAAAISQSVAGAARSTEEAIGRAIDTGTETATKSGQWISDRAQYLKDKGADGVEAFRGQVQRNALTSTAIAFGVGFLVSRLLFRR